MKYIVLTLLTVTMGLFSPAWSQVISCPSISSVLPFVKDVTAVPFPECYYMGDSAKRHVHNHCKQIQHKLEHRFSEKYQIKRLKLKSWGCHYNVRNQQKYYFYFAPITNTK